MTDRNRGSRGADRVNTTAGDRDSSSGEAEGTGSLGAPPTHVGRGALPDTDPAADGADAEQSDLGGLDLGGAALDRAAAHIADRENAGETGLIRRCRAGPAFRGGRTRCHETPLVEVDRS